jgi:leukotriene-A4 hydrolase
MLRSFLFGFIILLLFNACQSTHMEKNGPSLPVDPHSFAKPEEVRVLHQHFNLEVDFEKKQISGLTTLDLINPNENEFLYLDSRNLAIEKIWLEPEKKELEFWLETEKQFLGNPLKIKIKKEKNQKISIQYRTTEKADALQWLEPSQTAGKKHPFLFTQGQAILSRTWFPCQDGPGMRFTWSAVVKVPAGLEAIMSSEIRSADSSQGLFHFEMKRPVPAYLVALAVGDLAFAPIDERTGVFAEPSMLQRSVFEFSEMGKMVQAAENLYGKYQWGRYDVLVLPPSFPFGGMENPCVTFATPTILAGDRSLTSLIAHELAHSWSGNLVTNANWNDFWLNEGFTVYFERRIMESLEGKDYADMLAVLGYQDLQGTLADFGPDSPATCLKLNLEGKDPDDGMNDIAYEKGYLFLCQIEEKVGRKKWDAFLNSYFSDYAFQSMTTEKFITLLEEKLLKPNNLNKNDIQLDKWIYKPDLPGGTAQPVSSRFELASGVAHAFLEKGTLPASETKNWSSHEWLHFLREMPRNPGVEKMKNLDEAFHFTQTKNSEILFEWLMISIESGYKPAFEVLEQFLSQTGRRKFVLPLYKGLCKTPEGKNLARKWFGQYQNNYHAVTRNSLAGLF